MPDDLRTRIAYINALHNAVVDPRYVDQFRCNCGETFRWGDDWELHRADALIAELGLRRDPITPHIAALLFGYQGANKHRYVTEWIPGE